MKNCPYCDKEFNTWKSVRGHTSHCKKSNREYFIDLGEGPIHYKEFLDKPERIHNKYPNLRSYLMDIKSIFVRKGFNFDINYGQPWTKKEILKAIRTFYEENNRIPTVRDFNCNHMYPGHVLVKRVFGKWNTAIEQAGFVANYNDGFGNRIIGLDRHLYRSWYETYFANNYLYDKIEYIIEPKYPKPYNYYYDWFLPSMNLYIELDGFLRPERMTEKIKINKILCRNLLIIPVNTVKSFDMSLK